MASLLQECWTRDALGSAQLFMKREVDLVRTQGEPRLLEVKTYRYAGHSRTDPGAYRPDGELEKWQKRDPLRFAAQKLLDDGTSEESLAAVVARVEARVEAATAAAMESDEPEIAAMFKHVWCDGPAR